MFVLVDASQKVSLGASKLVVNDAATVHHDHLPKLFSADAKKPKL
jgi:hypothetical protein